MGNLTSVAAVKRYLSIATNAQDSLIAALIPTESRYIEEYTGRKFPFISVSKRLNGNGLSLIQLPDQPVLDVVSVSVLAPAQRTIVRSPDGILAGYFFDDTTLYVNGDPLPLGQRNILVSWEAGYRGSESAYIPAGNTPTITPTSFGWASENEGVVSANGLTFTRVANSPVAGQYTFSDGTYTFNSTNSDDDVTITFRYIPGAVEQACIEAVALDLRQRDSVGVSSKTLANESIAYDHREFTPSIRSLLYPYIRRAPV